MNHTDTTTGENKVPAEQYLEDHYTTTGRITYVKQSVAREYAELYHSERLSQLAEGEVPGDEIEQERIRRFTELKRTHPNLYFTDGWGQAVEYFAPKIAALKAGRDRFLSERNAARKELESTLAAYRKLGEENFRLRAENDRMRHVLKCCREQVNHEETIEAIDNALSSAPQDSGDKNEQPTKL